jgi:hypothetical protein
MDTDRGEQTAFGSSQRTDILDHLIWDPIYHIDTELEHAAFDGHARALERRDPIGLPSTIVR